MPPALRMPSRDAWLSAARAAARDALPLAALALIALWLRWPALSTEGFHNEDAAGITYNADLLRRGLLPLVDSAEVKAPGSFYLSAWVWAAFGRSLVALQRFMCAWSILAMLGVYAGGRLLYGRRAGIAAAAIYAVFSPITDSIDINYHAWMITPYVWSTALFLAALKTGRGRWLVASGAALAIAGLFKHQAAVLVPLFAVVIAAGPRLEWPQGWAGPPDRRRALLCLGLGLFLGFVPIGLWYLVHGELFAFVGTFFFSRTGWNYVQGELSWADKLARVGDGFLGLWAFLAVPSLLAAASLFSAGPPRWTLRGVLLGGHFWLGFAGVAIGFRFFKGYYIQVLPAAAWIAAMPGGPLLRWLDADAWRTWRRGSASAAVALCFAAALAPAAIGDIDELMAIRDQRRRARDVPARRVARVIRDNSGPDDAIWVWGRWAWPVYYHSDRLAPTRFYKTMDVLTTHLTSTWRRRTRPTRFVPDSPWQPLIADLEARPPAFIVVSRNEDYSQFAAFQALLSERYQPVPGMDSRTFGVYHRRDHALPHPPRARRGKPVGAGKPGAAPSAPGAGVDSDRGPRDDPGP